MSREFLLGCPGPLGLFKKFVQKKFVLIFRPLSTSEHDVYDNQFPIDWIKLGMP